MWHIIFFVFPALQTLCCCYLAGQYAARCSFERDQLILRLLAKHGECYGLSLVDKSGGQLRRGTAARQASARGCASWRRHAWAWIH